MATENETLVPLYESPDLEVICLDIKKMLEDASKKSKWSRNSGNSKHGDEIGVGGQKLKLTNIGCHL